MTGKVAEFVGYARMGPDEQKAAKRAYNRRQYYANLEHHRQRNRDKARSSKGEMPNRPMPDVCESCGGPPSGKFSVFHADHDHATGAFRGWLCAPCNLALGIGLEDANRFNGLVRYIRDHCKKA